MENRQFHPLPDPLVVAEPGLQSGVPVFAGTRVPVKNLFDYLERDLTLAAFLDDFPNVSRDHAIAVLETARHACVPTANRMQREAAEQLQAVLRDKMRVLLDNCVPRSFRRALSQHDVASATRPPWAALKDGPLLDAMEGKFDVLVTTDKSIPFQQNMTGRTVAVVILRARSNTIDDLLLLVPDLLAVLASIIPGVVVSVAAN